MAKQAVDIEDLLRWAYQRQQVDRAGVSSAEGCLSVMARGIPNGLGGGGRGPAALVYGAPVHADADAVHAVVTRPFHLGGLMAQVRDLVIYHARTGSRPDWMDGARPVLVPLLNGTGAPKALLDGNGKRVGCRIIEGVALRDAHTGLEVIERGTPHSKIAFERSRYAAWRAALVWIAAELRRARLDESEPLDPRAPAEPWNECRRMLDMAETA